MCTISKDTLEDLLPRIPAGRDVVDGSLKLDAQWQCHNTLSWQIGNRKKALTPKVQSLELY